jgi:hypothetical protein
MQRQALLDGFEALLRAWAEGDVVRIGGCLAPDALFLSNVHGTAYGPGIPAALVKDAGPALKLVGTNTFAAANDTIGVLSGYVFGEMSHGPAGSLYFGAMVVVDAACLQRQWLLTRMRLHLQWMSGNSALVSHWRLPAVQAWRPGDPMPVLVSEFDAPWRRLPHAALPGGVDNQLAEAFSRYAWAMDNADFELMRSCLAPDIEGEFTPLGFIKGAHAVIGVLKDFRQTRPGMQHFVQFVGSRVSNNGRAARMIGGHLIPGHFAGEDGMTRFGAHYDIELMLEQDRWLMRRFAYRPGWISFRQCRDLLASGEDLGPASR